MSLHAPETSTGWTALGTRVDLVVTRPGALAPARRLVEDHLAAVDVACSRFRPDSEIVALDGVPPRRGRIGPVAVSPLLAEAIGVALRAARLTSGDVDPTVGGAMSAAGYDRDFSLVPADGPAITLTVRKVPGWRTVSVAAVSCTDANTASTAAIIKGRAAPAWLARLGLPARLVAESGAVQVAGGWPAEGGEQDE